MAGNKIRASTQMTPGITTTGEADKLVVLDGAGGFIATGHVVQVVKTQTGEVQTTTAQVPNTDSIPQNTAGAEIMSLSITPKSASNILIIQSTGIVSLSGTNAGCAYSIFQDSIADALATSAIAIGPATGPAPCTVIHTMVAGTVLGVTFKIRAGPLQATTFTLNGSASSRRFGGVSSTTLIIWEIAA